MLSKGIVGSGFALALLPGTAWLIFWSYFYLALGVEGAASGQGWHAPEAAAVPTLALCWFGVFNLWRLFFQFIHAGAPLPRTMRLATLFAFAGGVQLALAFPVMTVLRPLPEVGLCLALHWGWLCSRGFGFGSEPEAG
jgi:hypothetical protein